MHSIPVESSSPRSQWLYSRYHRRTMKLHPFIVVKSTTREEINMLRDDIVTCAKALEEGCNGVKRFDPGYFVSIIRGFEENSVARLSSDKLKEGWFSGFFKERGSDKYEMITTSAVRRVSAEAVNIFFITRPLNVVYFRTIASTGDRESPLSGVPSCTQAREWRS